MGEVGIKFPGAGEKWCSVGESFSYLPNFLSSQLPFFYLSAGFDSDWVNTEGYYYGEDESQSPINGVSNGNNLPGTIFSMALAKMRQKSSFQFAVNGL